MPRCAPAKPRAASWPARRASSSPAARAASTTRAAPPSIPRIFAAGQPVLGICYGQQLMAHLLGGEVRKGDKGEYGFATLDLFDDVRPHVRRPRRAAADLDEPSRRGGARCPKASRWSGAPTPARSPPSRTPRRRLYGVQFHPEVVHTARGREYLANFVFGVCGCVKDWDARHRVPLIEQEIRECAGEPQRLLLRERRRGFDRGLRALHARAGRRPRARRLRRYRPDARGRDRFRAAPARHLRGARRRAVSGRARRRHRPGAEAPHHRRGVRARAGAHRRIAPPARRALDPGPGHHLSRHHRIGRHRQGRAHQDAPQPRRRASRS